MHIDHLDHLVLTVRNIEATCDFYERVLGMTAITFGDNRRALRFGSYKINLHQAGNEFEPKAEQPLPGSADLCFITAIPLPDVIEHVRACGVEIESGPVARTGAVGSLESIYLRDPDRNLIEISNTSNPVDVQQKVGRFVAEHDLECPPLYRLLDLASEVGEVAKEVLKATQYGQKPFSPPPDWDGELADALFALLCLANRTGVNLEVALEGALEKYSRRLAEKDDAGSGQ